MRNKKYKKLNEQNLASVYGKLKNAFDNNNVIQMIDNMGGVSVDTNGLSIEFVNGYISIVVCSVESTCFIDLVDGKYLISRNGIKLKNSDYNLEFIFEYRRGELEILFEKVEMLRNMAEKIFGKDLDVARKEMDEYCKGVDCNCGRCKL